jgi:phage terminase large subunit-like protein
MLLFKKMKRKVLRSLKENIRQWLDIPSGEARVLYQTELRRVRKEIEKMLDGSIVGVDLGYRDESDIIIIKYSRINNSFKVIANESARFEMYNSFIRRIRALCKEVNAEHIVIDAARGIDIDLVARILPDRKLTDMYKDRI